MVNHVNQYDGIILINTHETWLLKNLPTWDVFFMFEGALSGPLLVDDLLKAEISFTEEPDVLLKLRLSGKIVNIIRGKGKGTLLTSLENLYKIYQLAEEE